MFWYTDKTIYGKIRTLKCPAWLFILLLIVRLIAWLSFS